MEVKHYQERLVGDLFAISVSDHKQTITVAPETGREDEFFDTLLRCLCRYDVATTAQDHETKDVASHWFWQNLTEIVRGKMAGWRLAEVRISPNGGYFWEYEDLTHHTRHTIQAVLNCSFTVSLRVSNSRQGPEAFYRINAFYWADEVGFCHRTNIIEYVPGQYTPGIFRQIQLIPVNDRGCSIVTTLDITEFSE